MLRLGALGEHPLVFEGSAAVIWRLLEPRSSLPRLLEEVAAAFAVAPAAIEADLQRFLDDAVSAGAVTRGGQP